MRAMGSSMLFSTEISGGAFHGDVTQSRKLGKDEGEDTLDKLPSKVGIGARDQLMIDIL